MSSNIQLRLPALNCYELMYYQVTIIGICLNRVVLDFIGFGFYPRDAMLARVIAIVTYGLSVRLSVCVSRAGIVSQRRKLAA